MPSPPLSARAALVGLLAAATSALRTRDNFDADWRFLLGDPRAPTACPAGTFSPLPATQCLGFQQQQAATAAACEAACCQLGASCDVWTFAAGAGCWTGEGGCPDFLNNSAWVGGARAPGPAPPVACRAGDPCAVAFDDSAWRALRVPHDYGVEAAFDSRLDPGKGALPKNASWYRKTFTLPAGADALVYLEFDGVFRAADIFLNGEFVAHHEEGYTAFTVWLHNASAPVLRAAPNVLAVFVDGTAPELWSYEAMGITRHVWLNSAPALSVVPWGFFAPAVLAGAVRGGADGPQTADGATLAPQVDVANAGAAAVAGTANFALLDAAGATVCAGAAPFDVPAGGWARVTAALSCGSAAAPVRLWNTAAPYLHNATVALVDKSGAALDAASARIGVRSALFTAADGFTLNGAKVVLRGFSNHVGFGGCGGAVPERAVEFMLTRLLSIGGNAYRTAHNPVARELLDLADEYGVIVWSENRFVELGVLPSPRRAPAAAAAALDARAAARAGADPKPSVAVPRLLQDAQDMVLRDRNHASIVIWSLCSASARGARRAARGARRVR